MKIPRVVATAAVIAAIVLGIIFVPLPFHVSCSFEVIPQDSKSVFAGVPGMLTEVLVEPGERVQTGDVLARMDNVDLKLEVVRLRGEETRLQTQLDSLHDRRFEEEGLELQMPALLETLTMIRNQLAEKEQELGRLEITAPAEGVVFSPPIRPEQSPGDGRLPPWSGSPFDAKNKGALLTGVDQICQIGHPDRFEAQLVIDQSNIELVTAYYQEHQEWPEVDIKFDAYRWSTITEKIDKVASSPKEEVSESLSAQRGGELSTKADQRTGGFKPISTSYQARVPLDGIEVPLRIGLTGKAKVYTGWQPIGRRVARYLYRTFHFYL